MAIEFLLLVLFLGNCFFLWRQNDGGLNEKKQARAFVSVNNQLVENAVILAATSWLRRRVGLLNHSVLVPETGLLLIGTRLVHTMGMSFPIDCVFLDRNGVVVAVHMNVMPGCEKISGPSSTHSTLELAAGAADLKFGITVGSKVSFNFQK